MTLEPLAAVIWFFGCDTPKMEVARFSHQTIRRHIQEDHKAEGKIVPCALLVKLYAMKTYGGAEV
jgi:hypothetical protein